MPAPSARPAPPRSSLAAVFDTRFSTLVTPVVITWIYRGCMAVIALATVWCFLLAWWVSSLGSGWAWGVLGMLSAPVIGWVILLAVRVACEVALVWVRMGEQPAEPRAPFDQ